jgi:dTDP-4-dehydrorhamnose 3,5-epimerase
MKYEATELEIDDLILITPKVMYDERGFFLESYTKNEFEKLGIKDEFVQDNHSLSIKNTLRGLHFQREPYAQSKLVRCIKGSILDVAVDIRKDSSTFGKHVKVVLSSEDKKMLYIPRGFTHGFLVLSDVAEVLYKVDNFYSKEYESGIIWNDNELGIDWPIINPILSEKDKGLPSFAELKRELGMMV